MKAVSSERRKQITIPQRATTQKTCFLNSHVAKPSNHGFRIVRNISFCLFYLPRLLCLVDACLIFYKKIETIKVFVIFGVITLRTTKEMVILLGIKCWSSEWRLLTILLQSREERNLIPNDKNVSDKNLISDFSLMQIMVVRDHIYIFVYYYYYYYYY